MSTATDMRVKSARREIAAHQFATQITYLIRDYLGRNVIADVEAILSKAAYDNHLELTTLQMREEYEAHKSILLSLDPTGLVRDLDPTGRAK